MKIYRSEVAFIPLYNQCKATDCLQCVELGCPVNSGKVRFGKVASLMQSFKELEERSYFSQNPRCYYGECDNCANVSCGVWHGLAPEPTMPATLEEEWKLFWSETEEILLR